MEETTSFTASTQIPDPTNSRVKQVCRRRNTIRYLSTSALRGIILLINLLFGTCSILVLITSIFILADQNFQIVASQTKLIRGLSSLELQGIMILLLLGSIVTLCCSIFGTISTHYFRSSWLRIYSIVVGILAVIDAFSFAITIIYQAKMNEIYTFNLQYALIESLEDNHQITLNAFETIQHTLDCCGASGPRDYNTTSIPKSCSNIPVHYKQDYLIGCSHVILTFLEARISLFAISLLGFCVFELAAMIASRLLLSHLESTSRNL